MLDEGAVSVEVVAMTATDGSEDKTWAEPSSPPVVKILRLVPGSEGGPRPKAAVRFHR